MERVILVDEKIYMRLKCRRGGGLEMKKKQIGKKCLVVTGVILYLHPRSENGIVLRVKKWFQ